MPDQEQQETKSYRVSDRAADLIDAAIIELGITDEVAWDVICIPQTDRGPAVGIFWSEPSPVLGTPPLATLGVVPLPFTDERAVDAVLSVRRQAAELRSRLLAQAQEGIDHQNGHHPEGPPQPFRP